MNFENDPYTFFIILGVFIIIALIIKIRRNKNKSTVLPPEATNIPYCDSCIPVKEDITPPYDIPDVEFGVGEVDKVEFKEEIKAIKEEFKENKEVMKTSEAAHIMVDEKKAVLDQRHDEKKASKETAKEEKKSDKS